MLEKTDVLRSETDSDLCDGTKDALRFLAILNCLILG